MVLSLITSQGACDSAAGQATAGIKLERLSPEVPGTDPLGNFAPPREGEVKYRLGWSGFTAARVAIRIDRDSRGLWIFGEGGTVGLVRGIYRVNFEYRSRLGEPGLNLEEHRLTEWYRGVRVENEIRVVAGGIELSRHAYPTEPGDSGKARRYAISDALDLAGALLRFRSLPLAVGDVAHVRVGHGDRIYLARAEVMAREVRAFGSVKLPAIRVALSLKKVAKTGALEAHKKFRSATGWFSDDARRDLLRVEAEVFIGKLFAELEPMASEGH